MKRRLLLVCNCLMVCLLISFFSVHAAAADFTRYGEGRCQASWLSIQFVDGATNQTVPGIHARLVIKKIERVFKEGFAPGYRVIPGEEVLAEWVSSADGPMILPDLPVLEDDEMFFVVAEDLLGYFCFGNQTMLDRRVESAEIAKNGELTVVYELRSPETPYSSPIAGTKPPPETTTAATTAESGIATTQSTSEFCSSSVSTTAVLVSPTESDSSTALIPSPSTTASQTGAQTTLPPDASSGGAHTLIFVIGICVTVLGVSVLLILLQRKKK